MQQNQVSVSFSQAGVSTKDEGRDNGWVVTVQVNLHLTSVVKFHSCL